MVSESAIRPLALELLGLACFVLGQTRTSKACSMALYGNDPRARSWARLDWSFVYGYVLLCAGCYASYRGAPAATILLTTALLALPNVVRKQAQPVSPVEIGAHLVVALFFALLAHTVGWGIERAIGG
jgi:hypothetical protein